MFSIHSHLSEATRVHFSRLSGAFDVRGEGGRPERLGLRDQRLCASLAGVPCFGRLLWPGSQMYGAARLLWSYPCLGLTENPFFKFPATTQKHTHTHIQVPSNRGVLF